jgi:hydrogenase maturation protease
LLRQKSDTSVDIRVRFLHLLARKIAVPAQTNDFSAAEEADAGFAIVPSLEHDGRLLQTWQEANEREVSIPEVCLKNLQQQPTEVNFSFPANKQREELHGPEGVVRGLIIRRQEAVTGKIEIRFKAFETAQVGKLTVTISNTTPFPDASKRTRDDSLMCSLVSTHTILFASNGEFVSLLDPPQDCSVAVGDCNNQGTFPVLVGEEGTRDCILSSPIILYDYPQVAPESSGNLYDGTEIDEILTLRIMTLTDEEKREMRNADDRARQILERTEMLPVEQFMKMHGAMKGVKGK